MSCCDDSYICPHKLNFHSDVAKTPPECGEVLVYDCELGKWRPGQVTLDSIAEFCIDLESLEEGQVYFLKWGGTCFSLDVPDLNDLSDVSLTNPQEGQGLLFDGDVWVNSDNPPDHTLGFHSNVDNDVDSASTGNLLRFNGTEWEASNTLPAHSLGSHSNVNSAVDSATTGQVLTYNGTEWVAGVGAVAPHTLGSHSNVRDNADSVAHAPGYFLKSGVSGEWGPQPMVISDALDVQTTSPIVGQVLRWNGALWTNANVSGGGGGGGGSGGSLVGAVRFNSPSGPWTVISGSGFSVSNANGGTILLNTPVANAAALGVTSESEVVMGANITNQWIFGLGSPPETAGVILSFVIGPA